MAILETSKEQSKTAADTSGVVADPFLPQSHTFGAWREYVYKTVAAEISEFSPYYDELVQLSPTKEDCGVLFRNIANSKKSVSLSIDDLRATVGRSLVLLNGNLNYETDIEKLLMQLKPKLNRESRLVVVAYNAYFGWLYQLANMLGFRKAAIPETFLTETDLCNIARLAGFDIVKARNVAYCPWRLFGLGQLLNSLFPVLPWLKYLSLTQIVMLRPIIEATRKPSLTVLIPARNERGNIENALRRLPTFDGADLEIIFVEGHSTDGTWEEIERVTELYRDRFDTRAFKQSGKGKSDAVRLGFSKATKDLLVILDADLSMPPELLVRFYSAYCAGLADFINGSRLLYPIEGKAMKFLNRLGNIFFAKALSRVLGVRLSDTLCGTKLMTRDSYVRFTQWRSNFGDFDPFGDFELLFPASILGLGIIDVPIRYRDREYGETNISRFRHGFMLLKMTMVGLIKITLGRTPS